MTNADAELLNRNKAVVGYISNNSFKRHEHVCEC